MIDRDEMLETAKACGMKFAPAQFTGVLEAEISEFELDAYTKAVTKIVADAEREACAVEAEKLDCAMRCGVGSEVAATLRARGTGVEG